MCICLKRDFKWENVNCWEELEDFFKMCTHTGYDLWSFVFATPHKREVKGFSSDYQEGLVP